MKKSINISVTETREDKTSGVFFLHSESITDRVAYQRNIGYKEKIDIETGNSNGIIVSSENNLKIITDKESLNERVFYCRYLSMFGEEINSLNIENLGKLMCVFNGTVLRKEEVINASYFNNDNSYSIIDGISHLDNKIYPEGTGPSDPMQKDGTRPYKIKARGSSRRFNSYKIQGSKVTGGMNFQSLNLFYKDSDNTETTLIIKDLGKLDRNGEQYIYINNGTMTRTGYNSLGDEVGIYNIITPFNMADAIQRALDDGLGKEKYLVEWDNYNKWFTIESLFYLDWFKLNTQIDYYTGKSVIGLHDCKEIVGEKDISRKSVTIRVGSVDFNGVVVSALREEIELIVYLENESDLPINTNLLFSIIENNSTEINILAVK